MASTVEISDANIDERETQTSDKSETEGSEQLELEQGRVWRRGTITAQIDKQNSGPVLRTTVKPVKRFRPDSSADKTNPSPSRKKRVKAINSAVPPNSKPNCDESVASQNESTSTSNTRITNLASSTVPSPEGRGSFESACDNNEGENTEFQGNQKSVCNVAPVKKKRVWEQWSVEDKNYFFEAVATYGKDFEAIRTAIAQKHRKKGEDCVAKTKDQVRHLYYRTWTMISKIIDTDAYPLNINKAFQELYAVINYGELRKKLVGNLKKKGIEKLNELIRDGTTSTRIKGKNFRIKTPSCRALKKMNPEYQGKEGIHDLPLVSDTRRMKIPLHLTIELCPLTMAAWKQVHSIAHNPRLRTRVSVECQLSSIFAYLEKKWQPLSGRLLCVANHCQAKNASALQRAQKNTTSSKWDETLVLQTSPDASVNTRIMVFQVTNSKTHCVVSYALRKSMQGTEKLPESRADEKKSPEVKDLENNDVALPTSEALIGGVSESEAVDSCLSSEEDCDYESPNEVVVKDHDCEKSSRTTNSCDHESNSQYKQIETLDTTFVLKDKEYCLGSSPVATEPVTLCEIPEENEVEIHNASIANSNTNGTHSECQHENDMTDAQNIANHSITTNKMDEEVVEMNTNCPDVDNCVTSEPTVSVDETPNGNNCFRTQTEPDNCEVSEPTETVVSTTGLCDTLSNADKAEENKKGTKLLVSAKLFEKSNEVKKRRISKKSKAFTKTVQMWSAKDCRKTTIAEIYMMLGKPSVFRLCYHWLHTASSKILQDQPMQSAAMNHTPTATSDNTFLSTGLAALIQAAELSCVSSPPAGATVESNNTPGELPGQKLPSSKTKSIAIQCDLIKADDKTVNHPSSTNNVSSNPHGRGVSKIIPVETVIVDSIPVAGFAVPAIPVNRPRRIAANPNKSVQGTKVSAETMNWLLHRERSRNSRQVRKPIMVDRPQNRPNNNFKQMKTFSIVTCGPNKVGFLPSQPVLAPRTMPTVSNSSSLVKIHALSSP